LGGKTPIKNANFPENAVFSEKNAEVSVKMCRYYGKNTDVLKIVHNIVKF